MPWAIPPWLALVKFLGLTAKEHNKHDDDDNEDDNDDNRTTTMRWRRVRRRCKVEAGGMVCLLCAHEKIGSHSAKKIFFNA
jgi:hypothetical protein